jgi:hypothetical protein
MNLVKDEINNLLAKSHGILTQAEEPFLSAIEVRWG